MKIFKIFAVIILVSAVFTACQQNTAPKMQTKVVTENVDSLIAMMTLEEKINLLHASSSFTSGGVERLGIPEIVMSDGPHGVRMEHGRDWQLDEGVDDAATYLPTGICLASTWNKALGYDYGAVLGSEANERGKDIILGPGINIIRSPLNGRNFEYLSEDPYLTSQMCIGYIKGVQDQGVGACAKHFVANNQEFERHTINAVVSERALREIYYPAFKTAVDAGVASIMSAYNKLNGTFCSSHENLLDDVLRKEFGFDGIVVSDWAAVHETNLTLKYGCDIEMGTDLDQLPNPNYDKFYLAKPALNKVKAGEISEAYVDKKVQRILSTMKNIHMFDERPTGKRNTEEHQKTALKVAEEGMVLLKNEAQILPINKQVKTIAVIGENAIIKHAHKGGSSQVKALYEVTPLEAIKKIAGESYTIEFAKGYEVTKENKANKALISEAITIAKNADLVLFIGGWVHSIENNEWGKDSYDAEALDKENFDLRFGQQELLDELIKSNDNFISVIFGGSSVKFGAWSDHSKAILQVWYPGMEGGTALANIVFGKTNPSGKLPVSFANNYSDYSDHQLGEYPGNGTDVVYKDDIFVGYRYFDTYNKEVAFPFGHGLSYTSFEYGKLFIDKNEMASNDNLAVSFTLKNTGKMDGAEVIQLYVKDESAELKRPEKELKAFEKVFLKQGEEKKIEFELDKSAFSYFHPDKGWVIEPGKFQLLIGSSSRDIRQTTSFHIK